MTISYNSSADALSAALAATTLEQLIEVVRSTSTSHIEVKSPSGSVSVISPANATYLLYSGEISSSSGTEDIATLR